MLLLIMLDNIYDVHSLKSFITNTSGSLENDSLNLTYSVQIAASYNTKMNADSIKHKFHLSADIKEIFHHGWYKYSTGSFTNINDAKKLRQELCRVKGLGGAFIVCFKNNIRQETIIFPKNVRTTNNEKRTTNYEYRIQLKASYNHKIPLDTIAKEFNLIEKINEDIDNGWYKYTVGAFDDYKSAKEYRDKLRQKKGLSGCFVVAYEKGQRLSHLPEQNYKAIQTQSPVLVSNTHANDTRLHDSLDRVASLSRQLDSLKKDSVVKAGAHNDNIAIINKKKNQQSTTPELKPKGKSIQYYIDRSFFYIASASYPGSLNYIIEKVTGKRNHNNKRILILCFLIIFLVISFLLITIISIFILIVKSIRGGKTKRLSAIYQSKLEEYISSIGFTNDILKELKALRNNSLRRRLLAEEMLSFNKTLTGEAKAKLRGLYIDLNLHEDAVKYIKSNSRHKQAKGISQLAQMNVAASLNLIENKLNSTNDFLSFEAQMAMVRLNYDSPFSFLIKIKKHFPLWSQLNIHMLINTDNIKVPDFSVWLKSENYYITVFALRMIGIFRQHKSFSEVVLLLNSPNQHIKQNAIIALGRLGLNEASIYLRNIYHEETNDNKVIILKALQNMPDESNIRFLGDILLQADNVIKLEAAKCLAYIGEKGRSKLQVLKMTADVESANTVSVIDHVLDRRIV